MKKSIIALVLALSLILALTGCANNAATTTTTAAAETTTTTAETTTPAAAAKDVAIDDILSAVIPEDLQMTMLETDPEMVKELTGLDLDLVEEGKYFDPAMNVKCFTVYAAKAKDASGVDAIKTAFEARLKAQQESFERYLPDQYELAQKGQIVTEGNYVLLVILVDTQASVDAFHGLFK